MYVQSAHALLTIESKGCKIQGIGEGGSNDSALVRLPAHPGN